LRRQCNDPQGWLRLLYGVRRNRRLRMIEAGYMIASDCDQVPS
jgi:hypothetical protein